MQISKPAGTFVHEKSGSREEKKKKEKKEVERSRQSATFGVKQETCIAFLGEVDCPCQYRLPLDTTEAGACSRTKQSRSSAVLLSVHLYQLLCAPSIVHLSLFLLLSVRQWSSRRAGPKFTDISSGAEENPCPASTPVVLIFPRAVCTDTACACY